MLPQPPEFRLVDTRGSLYRRPRDIPPQKSLNDTQNGFLAAFLTALLTAFLAAFLTAFLAAFLAAFLTAFLTAFLAGLLPGRLHYRVAVDFHHASRFG